MKKHILTTTIFVVILAFLLPACSSAATQPPASSTGDSEIVTLRIARIPVLDALPMYVAQSEGLFARHGVNAEFIPVKSAPERDQLIAAEGADGMVNEVLSAMFFNQDEIQVQVVRFAQAAASDAALFRIIASADSGITGPEGLKGVEIGISEGTVIEYVTDRILQAEGFSPSEIQTVAVPDITARMTLLGSGELQAAVLPEPLSSLTVLQGGTNAIDDSTHPEYSYSVLTFRKAFIDEHPEAIRGFLAAVEEAVEIINRDPAALKDLLVEQNLVPAPLQDTFVPNKFVTAGVPSEEQWNDALEWAKEKGLITKVVSYSETVTAEYLP